MVPRAVLMKSSLVSVNTARQVNVAHIKIIVNAARPMSYLSKKAHSTVKRPKAVVNAARPKAVVNAARPKAVVNAVKRNNVNAGKASACWVWKPKTKVLDHVSKHNSASITLKKFNYVDAQGKSNSDQRVIDSGCSRHMTRNMSYLTDYDKIDEGYVAFGWNPKGGKITGKDEAIYKEFGDRLVRAATTASSLEAEQDSGGGLRHEETMGDTTARTRFESVFKLSNDPLLARGNTLQSGEDSLKLNELMELCTNLQTRVLDLEKTKTTQANKINSLKRRVRRLEKKKRSRTHGLKMLYKGRINALDADKDITLVNDQDDADMFDVNTLAGEEVFVAEQSGNVVEEVVAMINAASIILVSAATITDVEVTLVQALAELKSAKPKADKVVIQEPDQGTTTTTPTIVISIPKPPQYKGKGIMIEEPVVEQVKPMKRLEQIRLDEELAFKLQAEEEEEEERLAREKT
ncbi:hypothetical protein Tco_1562108 [Tanacetum coccineum]